MLIDLATAKHNLKVESDDDDENLVELIEEASAIVLDYLKIASDSYQDANGSPLDVPPIVRAATLLVLRSLYDEPTADPITKAVVSLLMRSRDPALA